MDWFNMQVSCVASYAIVKRMEKIGAVELPATGYSMFPLIKQGDICRFVSCNTENLKKGDIALFYTASGQLIAHRFYQTITHQDKVQYLFKGDTNIRFDEPIDKEQIIGELVTIQKKRIIIDMNSRMIPIWNQIVYVPVMSRLLRKYIRLVKA
ncbi:signal peptidase I [Ectobacillus polymachus]|uniref:signal peptidase I n=1 Tax=Ectobacillus polymachus TaxID=1508806 RepID=UPI003A880C01